MIPVGNFGGQPMQPQVQQPMGGSSSPANIKYRNPMQPQVQQPQVQQPMGGFPGMGQQGLPSGMMQHIQQLQQQMPPMQPQKPVSAARQYLDAVKQYRQGGSQGPRPLYSQFKQPQPQPQPQPQSDLMQRIQQVGGMPGQQLGGMPGQQLGGMPGQQLGGIDAYQQFLAQQRGGTGMPPIGQPMSDPFKPQISGGPVGGGFGPGVNNYSAPQPMTQPPAGGFGAAPPPPPPPALGMAMGGSVGMAPPNPYAQQIGQEDPRMQAMRYMQQMNFGG
jgi:hypothetical protein